MSEMVKELMEVPKTISQGRIQQQTLEQIVDTPVLQVVEELAEVFSQDWVQQLSGEQIIETAALPLAENVVEMAVAQTQEKMQQDGNAHVQHVASTVEVERSKLIKQTVQKPVTREKINQVTKHIEIPQNQHIDKIVDMLDAVQRQVSMVQKIQIMIETSQLQFSSKVDEMPVAVQRQTPWSKLFRKPWRFQSCSVLTKSQMQVVDKAVEGPQVQIVEQIVDPREPDDPEFGHEARRPSCQNQVPRGRRASRSWWFCL